MVLLVISSKAQTSKAQTWCKARGIDVGFLGPTKASIEQARAA